MFNEKSTLKQIILIVLLITIEFVKSFLNLINLTTTNNFLESTTTNFSKLTTKNFFESTTKNFFELTTKNFFELKILTTTILLLIIKKTTISL